MASTASPDVTSLLRAWNRGDASARDRLAELVYTELRRQAAMQLRRERADHTLSPTALVHEAYLRLIGQRRTLWKNRSQFYAIAARTMRRVLVDHARQRRAAKRAGSWRRVSLDENAAANAPRELDLVALDAVLGELEALDPDKARLVELRFFAGLSLEDTAASLGVSASSVTRQWRLTRAWLYRRLA